MKEKYRIIILCVAFKIILMCLDVNVTVQGETVN